MLKIRRTKTTESDESDQKYKRYSEDAHEDEKENTNEDINKNRNESTNENTNENQIISRAGTHTRPARRGRNVRTADEPATEAATERRVLADVGPCSGDEARSATGNGEVIIFLRPPSFSFSSLHPLCLIERLFFLLFFFHQGCHFKSRCFVR